MTTISLTPLSDAIGVRVDGLDLSHPLRLEDKVMLKQAFNNYIVVLMRDQKLDEDKLPEAASWLGRLTPRSRPAERRLEESSFISKVSNIREGGKLIGSLPDGEMFFHFDGSFLQKPHAATFLYAVEIPKAGGETCFANMYKAYDLLPGQLKSRIEGKTAVQVYDYTTIDKPFITDASLKTLKHFSHPVALTHPITGKKSLYISRLMTARVNGVSQAESDDLLNELYEYAEHRSVIYEHRWRVGDFIAWDNLCSTHARKDFSAAERRLLLRGIIEPQYQPCS